MKMFAQWADEIPLPRSRRLSLANRGERQAVQWRWRPSVGPSRDSGLRLIPCGLKKTPPVSADWKLVTLKKVLAKTWGVRGGAPILHNGIKAVVMSLSNPTHGIAEFVASAAIGFIFSVVIDTSFLVIICRSRAPQVFNASRFSRSKLYCT
jgi:hypothetical protein